MNFGLHLCYEPIPLQHLKQPSVIDEVVYIVFLSLIQTSLVKAYQ